MAFSENSTEALDHAHEKPGTILRISLLGPFLIERVAEDGKISPIPTERLSGRGAAPALGLLKALLSQPDRFATRDWLIEQFWPDSSVRKAEERLDDVASGLRSLLRPPEGHTKFLHYVYASNGKGGGYRLDGYPLVWVDADALVWYVEQATRFERFGQDALPLWEQAYQLAAHGMYLPEECYSDWAQARREELAGHYRQCVHRLSTLLHERGASEQAILYLRMYWQQNKTDEDALRILMELLGEQERYQEAEEYYQQLLLALAECALAEDGDGQRPDPRTREMREYLRTKQIHGKLMQSSTTKAAEATYKSVLHLSLNHTQTLYNPEQQNQYTQENFDFSSLSLLESIKPPLTSHSVVHDAIVYEPQMLPLIQTYSNTAKLQSIGELQVPIQTILTDLEALNSRVSREQLTLTRRQMLIALAVSPLAILSSYLTSPLVEVFLPQCAASLVACNHLLKSQDFWHIKQILPRLIPALTQILKRSSQHQATAAHLIAQCYLLLGILESHQLNWPGYQSANEHALQMSLLTPDKSLQVVSYVQLAMSFFHFEQPDQALSLYQRAAHLAAESSPLMRSNFFVKQAVAYGQAGRVTEMQRCLEQAYTHFPENPESDPSSLFTDFAAPSLFSWKATAQLQLVRRQLETPANIWRTLSQADQLPLQHSAKVLAYVQNLRAEAALMLNDLEAFTHFLTVGIQEAKRLKSVRRLQEAIDCYHLARKQWPHEGRVQQLAELFIEERLER